MQTKKITLFELIEKIGKLNCPSIKIELMDCETNITETYLKYNPPENPSQSQRESLNMANRHISKDKN